MNYLDIFSTNPLTSNFTKTHSVETELMHADRQLVGRTDRHNEDNSCFSQSWTDTWQILLVIYVFLQKAPYRIFSKIQQIV